MGKNISDDNRYEHGAVRSNAGMLIPVSGTEAAKQRSDAWTYTVCGILYLENADRIVTREACVRDCMRFRRQQVFLTLTESTFPSRPIHSRFGLLIQIHVIRQYILIFDIRLIDVADHPVKL